MVIFQTIDYHIDPIRLIRMEYFLAINVLGTAIYLYIFWLQVLLANG